MTNVQAGTRPLIEIFYTQVSGAEKSLKKLSEGIEEEGVPYQFVVWSKQGDNATQIACQAAHASLLEVGIGMDGQGNLALHYRKLPDHEPLFVLAPPYSNEELRCFGSHAARLIKGLPFRLDEVI